MVWFRGDPQGKKCMKLWTWNLNHSSDSRMLEMPEIWMICPGRLQRRKTCTCELHMKKITGHLKLSELPPGHWVSGYLCKNLLFSSLVLLIWIIAFFWLIWLEVLSIVLIFSKCWLLISLILCIIFPFYFIHLNTNLILITYSSVLFCHWLLLFSWGLPVHC